MEWPAVLHAPTSASSVMFMKKELRVAILLNVHVWCQPFGFLCHSDPYRKLFRPAGQTIDLLRQIEVLLRQPALAVGGQGQLDLVPTDIDVWMVIGLFGHARHFVHEIHRRGEVFEFVSALDLGALFFPACDGSQSPFDLFRCQFCHDLPVAQWPLLATMPIRIFIANMGAKAAKKGKTSFTLHFFAKARRELGFAPCITLECCYALAHSKTPS
jgi:hypothetical protein